MQFSLVHNRKFSIDLSSVPDQFGDLIFGFKKTGQYSDVRKRTQYKHRARIIASFLMKSVLPQSHSAALRFPRSPGSDQAYGH